MRTYLFLLFAVCCSCQHNQKTSHELETVKSVLAMERKAHFEKNVDLMLSNGVDTVLNVKDGMVKNFTLQERRERFTNYFNAVEFIKWDDVAKPIFHFSDDSTMASVIVQKQVILKELSEGVTDTTDFAWTAVYRKIDGAWKLISSTSTNK